MSFPQQVGEGGRQDHRRESLCWYPNPANMPLDMVWEEGEMRATVVCSMVERLNGKMGERVVITPDDGLMVEGRREISVQVVAS